MAYGARLESVLGASPRGFESPILRKQVATACQEGREVATYRFLTTKSRCSAAAPKSRRVSPRTAEYPPEGVLLGVLFQSEKG